MSLKTNAIAAQWDPAGRRTLLYGIGTDNAMYYKIWNGDQSLPSRFGWLSLGGQFDSTPAVLGRPSLVAWDAEVFGLGLNNEMFHLSVNNNVSFPPPLQAWRPLGGIFNSPPTAIYVGQGLSRNWVIIGLGTDNQPYLKLFNAEQNLWLPSVNDWLPLGGKLIYELDFALIGVGERDNTGFAPKSIALFGVGTGRQMFQLTVDVSQWPPSVSGWQMLGGCFASPPAVAQWGPNRMDVFGLGMGLQMFHRAWENDQWLGDWEYLGGEFDSSPAAVAWGQNTLFIFGLGTDDQMYWKTWNGTQWLPSPTDWEPLGGVFTSAPTLAPGPGAGRLDIFGLGTDFQMYVKELNLSGFIPSQTDWEPLGGVFKIPRPTQIPAQLDFDWPITFSDGTPIGGSLRVTLFNDGRSSFSGHLHDSGFPSYSCSIGCAVIDGKNRAYTFEEFGNVWGTDLPGSRNHDWNKTTQPNSSLRDNWSNVFACGGAKFGARVDVQTNPPGGLVHEVSRVLQDLAGGTPLTVIPLVGSAL